MQHILLLGAGRSSSSLIGYLLHHAEEDDYELTVADLSSELALKKTKGHLKSRAIAFDINNAEERGREIERATLVISLLPPGLHVLAAEDCVTLKRNLITASYLSPAISELDKDAKRNGVLILNECGLDPGIDHMSAMQIIHRLKSKGAVLTAFKSYTGGLIAPEYNDNPWGYKFTWNPKNVILAGQSTAKYIENGDYRYLPYSRLFTETEQLEIDGLGTYEGYANRDSLAYRKYYELDDIPTLLRGTLRQKGFCKAWNAFVQLGLTDDNCIIENSEVLTYRSLVEAFLPAETKQSKIEERFAAFMKWLPGSTEMEMLISTGVFEDKVIGIPSATAARALQQLLEAKWMLKEHDKDMIIMQHLFEYKLEGKKQHLTSTLVVKGNDQVQTAMAKTVGYPLGIIARLLLNKKINLTGVQLPLHPSIYNPVLKELEELDVVFKETENAS